MRENLSGMLKIEEINTFDELNSYETILTKALEESGSDNIFLTFDWMTLWWKHFPEKKELKLLVAKENGKIVALFPLVLSSIGFKPFAVGKIEFLGSPEADYLDFILPKPRFEIILAMFSYLLSKIKSWNLIVLQDIPADSPNLKLIEQALMQLKIPFRRLVSSKAPYLKINSSWEEYFGAKKRKFRYNLQRNWRRLEEVGKVKLERISFPYGLEKNLEEVVELHRKRWKEKYTRSVFSTEKGARFYTELAQVFSKKGWFDLALLKVNDKVVASSYSFIYGGKFYYYIPAYDPEYYDYSPGALLLKSLLKDSFKGGIKEFDFMKGEEDYKYRWASHERQNFAFVISNLNLYSRLVYWIYLGFLNLRQRARKYKFLRLIRQNLLGKLKFFKKS